MLISPGQSQRFQMAMVLDWRTIGQASCTLPDQSGHPLQERCPDYFHAYLVHDLPAATYSSGFKIYDFFASVKMNSRYDLGQDLRGACF